jgi:hypothetical protein
MSNYTGTPASFPTNSKIKVASLADWEDLLDALSDDYVTYVPTFTGSGVALGNGVLSGFYKQVGKQVDAVGSLIVGSTTTLGAAPTVALPVAHNVGTGGPLGTVTAALSAAAVRLGGWCWANGASSMALAREDGTRWGATVPITFTTNSEIRWILRYRSA